MPTITDWLMVAITIVYVVATIIICYANIKSSNATKEQVAEAKRQYEEEHRAYITYEFFFSRRTYYGLRFTNQGKRLATNVQILLKQEFVDCISSEFFDGINELKNKEFTLGIGQSYDIYLGASDFRNNQNKKPIEGKILYKDAKSSYSDTIFIDFDKYVTFFSVRNNADELLDDMKQQNIELKNITKELQQLNLLKAKEDEESHLGEGI